MLDGDLHLGGCGIHPRRFEGGVDQVLGNQEKDDQERLMTNHQVDRHEGWIEQAAPILGLPYDAAA